MKTRAHVIAKGRVQGVCFRMYTRGTALELGLTGWVRNQRDGSVEIVAEGEDKDVVGLVQWCRHGPPLARVTQLIEDYAAATGEFDTFSVRY